MRGQMWWQPLLTHLSQEAEYRFRCIPAPVYAAMVAKFELNNAWFCSLRSN